MNDVIISVFTERVEGNRIVCASTLQVASEMGIIKIPVSAIRIARYFCIGSVSIKCFTTVSVSIKHVFVHRRYKYLDTVFEHDQSYQVLTSCSFTVSEECEMKLNSLIDSKRRTVRKFILSLAYLQLFRNDVNCEIITCPN